MSTDREFVVCDGQDFVEAFGAEPEPVEGEPAARTVEIESGDDRIVLTYDSPGRSVRFQWLRGDMARWDMIRESATRLAVESSGSDTSVVVRFEAGELSGELVVTVFPEVRVQDRMLFV